MNNNYKFIFFGTSIFSKIVLEKLINCSFWPAALVTNPDKAVGRKKIVAPPPTKKFIIENKLEKIIKILQPETLDTAFINELKKINADFGIVCAYAKILPLGILNIFPKGVLGIHPSLLPKYRGPSPIQTAILKGEKVSGVTIYLLDEKVDHGPILSQEKCDIFNLNFEEALIKLAEIGGRLICDALPKFLENKITPIPQDEKLVTYTQKFKTEDGYIDLKELEEAINIGGEKAEIIERKIKALNPEPGVWTIKNNKRMKILETTLINNRLKIIKIQFEGERPKNME